MIGLRREIQRVAQDYDYDWKGQLEDLEQVDIVNKQKSAMTTQADRGAQRQEARSKDNRSSTESTRMDEDHDADNEKTKKKKIDIDATIDEAVELEQQTRSKEKQRLHGKGGKGEALESGKDQGEKRAKKYVVGEDVDD